MFCEKMRVAVKAMNVITFVVKKGARTVSGASAVAVAMSSPLPSCDGTTCPYRRARRGRRGRFYRDQLLGLRLELTESVQDPNDLWDGDGVVGDRRDPPHPHEVSKCPSFIRDTKDRLRSRRHLFHGLPSLACHVLARPTREPFPGS